MIYFNINDFYNISISGKGEILKNLQLQFNGFETDNLNKNLDNELKIYIDKFSQPVNVIGKIEKQAYQKKGNRFFITHNKKSVVLHGDKELKNQLELFIEPDVNSDLAMVAIETIMRIRLIESGIILTHSAAVSKNNESTFLLAWQGTGKTTNCLSLLKQGFAYQSDDRIWLNKNGVVYYYPRYIRINKSNFHLFYKKFGLSQQVLYYVHEFLRIALHKIPVFKASKVLQILINSSILLPSIALKADDYDKKITLDKKSNLRNIIFLDKSDEKYKLETVEKESFATIMSSINAFEWNNKIRDIAVAHDVMFPEGPNWFKEVEVFVEKENLIIKDIIEKTKTYRFTVPIKQEFIPDTDIDNLLKRLSQ